MKEENQRIAITKWMLQEGLIRLLKTTPIEKIKVTALCQESGINRATFYRHYASPQDVLDEMLKTILQEIRILVFRNPGEESLQKRLEVICQYCYNHAEQLEVLFANHPGNGFAQVLNEFNQEHLPEFQRLRQGQPIDITDLQLASYYYAGGFFLILRQWLTEKIDRTPEEIAGLICRFISGNQGRV